MHNSPALLILDDAQLSYQPPVDAAALVEQVAWLRFAAPWRAQSERNRHLVANLTQHSKSRFTQNVFGGEEVRQFIDLQASFATDRAALVAVVEAESQEHQQRLAFQRRLGF